MKKTSGFYSQNSSGRKSWNWFFACVAIQLLLCFAVQLIFPWWSLIIICLLLGYILESVNKAAFTSGFLALFICWGLVSGWADAGNDSILSARIVKLFPIPASSLALIILTAFLGGLIGGFSTLTGHTFRTLNRKKDIASMYY